MSPHPLHTTTIARGLRIGISLALLVFAVLPFAAFTLLNALGLYPLLAPLGAPEWPATPHAVQIYGHMRSPGPPMHEVYVVPKEGGSTPPVLLYAAPRSDDTAGPDLLRLAPLQLQGEGWLYEIRGPHFFWLDDEGRIVRDTYVGGYDPRADRLVWDIDGVWNPERNYQKHSAYPL